MRNIILASASPRRSELLSQIGIEFTVKVSDVDENIEVGNPADMVMQLSKIKANAVYEMVKENIDDTIIIGADTVVVLDGKVLGKPKDEEDAFAMLKSLSDRVHEVITGVTLMYIEAGNVNIDTFYEQTQVHTYSMGDEEIKEYIISKEPMDKAGSYGIQGLGGKFIKKIDGDYNNVVGLPVSKIYQKLKKKGV